MLSAKELLDLRSRKAHPRSLPTMPPKDFVPTHSAEETATINAIVEEKMTYLKEERAERRNLLTKADWLPQEKVAKIEKKLGGGWDVYGFDKNGKTYLQPEEALFLIELSKLELWYSGTPVSVQQAYQILLVEDLCSTLKYRVYSHLCRQGYRLVRRVNSPSISIKRSGDAVQVSSPKRVRTDEPSNHSVKNETSVNVSSEKQYDSKSKLLFGSSAAEPSDYDCIPHLLASASESVLIQFSDLEFLPESIRNRESTYVINKKDFLHFCVDREEVATSISLASTNNPLFSGKTKPLLLGNFIGDPYYANDGLYNPTDEELNQIDEDDLQISYDVYSPGRHFRKSNPGTPCFMLAIAEWSSNVPSLLCFERFKRRCGPKTVPLVAVSGAGSGISFYQLKGVVSPM
ncbi:uncharacterized protein LOC116925295 [Daphnia magna]|uniref:tRNA-splicing endonuclease subunit Sen54 N-terminal domain-containing protein n=1 Tax=Daphnia magna TaxID=35525 RepID=A0ABQ9ZV19_9CRUS|nr:uncharacterized protein LOC116925295 [Daphnia magna]KAK4016722.1 hypothetical protein OUZ56_031687 [Daphnia magna]